MKIILKSKGFLLRHVKLSDAKAFFECETDPISKKGFMSYPKSIKEVENFIKREIAEQRKKRPSEECFAIDVNGEFAGFIKLHDLNKKHAEHKGVIGYCLHPKFRGKGIMTKAVKLVTNYAFKRYKLKRLSGWCRTFNKASARVLENSGYKLEGIMRKNKFKDGKYLDDMIWAMIR